jgi:hypothetical protein
MSEGDKEQIKEILTFLEKPEARTQALEILLGLTGTPEGRKHFRDTDSCKQMIRVIVEEPEN